MDDNAGGQEAEFEVITGSRKRLSASTYSTKSERTIRRHKKLKKDRESKGFFSLPDFFKQKAEQAREQESLKAVQCHEEEEEEGEETGEEEANSIPRGVCAGSADSDPSPTHASSCGDPTDSEQEQKSCWGPSRTILYESEESSSCGDTPSEPEVLPGADLEVRCCGDTPDSEAAQQLVDDTLKLLRDRAGLQVVQGELNLLSRSKELDAVLRDRIAAMSSLLNLFLDDSLGYTWTKASEVAARAEGSGKTRARSLRQWVLNFVRTRDLPGHQYGKARPSVLNNDDLAHEMKLALSERAKSGFLTANDVVEVVSSPEMQAQFSQAGIQKSSISKSTALRWLGKMGWRYGRHQNGMYIDGHERDDVVEYRQNFVERFKGYERRSHSWDDDGNELPRPLGFLVPGAIGRFRLVLITHDESIFYQNDQRQIHWGCPGQGGIPKPKGEGLSLMVSDFLTPDWGRLRDEDGCVFMAPFPINSTHICAVMPALSFGLGRTGMAGLQLITSLSRSTVPLIFSRGSHRDMHKGCSYSTTHPATRNALTMQSQLGRWSKVCFYFDFPLVLISLQDHRRVGHITLADHACVVVHYLPENSRIFITPKITPPCPAGSRAWSKSFGNVSCGQMRGCQLSASNSSVPLRWQAHALTAAAGVSFFVNLISLIRFPSSRS